MPRFIPTKASTVQPLGDLAHPSTLGIPGYFHNGYHEEYSGNPWGEGVVPKTGSDVRPTQVLGHLLKVAADVSIDFPTAARFSSAVNATVGGKPATDLQLAKAPPTVFGMKTNTGRSLSTTPAPTFASPAATQLPSAYNAREEYAKAIANVDSSEHSPYRHGSGTSTMTSGGSTTFTGPDGKTKVVKLPTVVNKEKYALGMDGITGSPVEMTGSGAGLMPFASPTPDELRERLSAPNAALLPHYGG